MNTVSDDDLVDLDRTASNTHRSLLAMGIPPAAEPLEPELLNVLGQQVAQAFEHLSGGQLPLSIRPVSEPTTQVPEDLASGLVALENGLRELTSRAPDAEKYAFDAAEGLRTNDGVKDLIGITGMMCYDKRLISQMQGGQSADVREDLPPG